VTAAAPTESRGAQRRIWALVLWAGLSALQIGVSFAAQGGSTDAADEPIYDPSLGLFSIVVYSVVIGLAFGIASLFADRSTALGLRSFRGRHVALAAGVVLGSLIIAAALEPVLHAGEEQGLTPETWQPEHAGAFVFNALVIVTIVPFAEELFFRGIGVTVLSVLGTTAAIIISAVVFAFAHGLLVAIPPLIVVAAGLAWVRVRSDSVWPGVLAHAAYNGIGLALAVASGL
jgi:membrane protease YdiL (CAAX protease family)